MTDRTFYRVLAAVVALCTVLTLAHVGYGAWAYQNSSIVQFIAKEPW